MEDRLKPKTKY